MACISCNVLVPVDTRYRNHLHLYELEVGVPDNKSGPVRYPAGFQENVLSGIRPHFLQCPAGCYLKIIILNNRII